MLDENIQKMIPLLNVMIFKFPVMQGHHKKSTDFTTGLAIAAFTQLAGYEVQY